MPPTTRVQSSGSQAVDRTPWVLFEAGDEGQSVRAANREDIDEARRHRQGSEAMVWFRHNGVAYVSRNAQLLDGLRESFATVHAIGERLSAAGARQGLEGARQGQVGERQGALGAEMGRHGARIAELTGQLLVIEGERLQAADRQMTAEQATRRAALRAELDKVEREMRTLGGQQRELAREMEGNAAQMREESTKMEALGAEMRRAVDEAMRRVSGLFDKAVSEGTARPAM
jgi:chromosome segregation ATPase